MTPEQLDEIEKLAALWDKFGRPKDAAAELADHALPLVKALREARAALDQVSSDDHMSEAQITAAITEAQKERDAARNRLSHLLARIHRDGGHYEIENGTEKATEDAEKIVVEDRQSYVSWRDTALATAQERDEAGAEVERLKESVANLDKLYVSRTDALRESEAEVERLRSALRLLWEEAQDESRCQVESGYGHLISQPCWETVTAALKEVEP